MNWKAKAKVQNLIAKLPPGASHDLYYFVQRRFGRLKRTDPLSRFEAAVALADRIRRQDRTIESRSFLEVGTGRCVNLPLALWLCGASRVITVDLNRYLAPELQFRDLDFVRENRRTVLDVFGSYAQERVFKERFERLLELGTRDIGRLLSETNIEYAAPADAARLALESHSVDYHVSYFVLEHVPPETLRQIVHEGKRVLKRDGLFVHRVDFSDHFSHTDPSISAINFLRFDEREWERYAGNRFMYHNRLRVDELTNLLETADLKILSLETRINERALDALGGGFPLNERFRGKTREANATTSAWVVATARDAVYAC